MENSFTTLGDEFRAISHKIKNDREILITSFYDQVQDMVVKLLREDCLQGIRKCDIKMDSLFRTNLSISFNKSFPTTNELNWYAEKLEEYFRKERLTVVYNKNNFCLTVEW